MDGAKFAKVIFHGPRKNETYKGHFGDALYYAHGNYLSFTNGIVWDLSNGLEWVVGPDKDMNWKEARIWVKSLSLDGGGWRMPTVRELKSLYNSGSGTRNMIPPLVTTGYWVWSGKIDSSFAWCFRFNYGLKDKVSRDYSKNLRAFAVRSRGDD